jgi:hypothetical protein
MTSLNWLADAVLAVLLVGTLIMSIRLDRALRVVRRDRAAFEALITNLGAATASVKTGIQGLRSEAERAADQIERRTGDADKMATDLSFLIEAAERAAALLDSRVQMRAAEPSDTAQRRDADAPQTGAPREAAEIKPRPVPARATASTPPDEQDGSTDATSTLYHLAGITRRRRPVDESRRTDDANSPAKRAAL